MKNSLLITKYIRTILEQDKTLMAKISIKQFFPIDAKLSTKFPFCVVRRTGMNDFSSKDGIYEDQITVSLIVVDDNYFGSIEIANEIRNWLEAHRYSDDTINITQMRLTSSTEGYLNDAYIQELIFTITIQNS
jgi:hypothetical protein